MNSDDYLPRVLEDDFQPEISVPSDASKWTAVHDALESTNTIGSRSGTGSLFTVAWVLGLTLGLVWVWRNGRTVFQQWQENMHRRANRRRHGIPDDDDRPFNVAYTAAALSRKQREEKQQEAIPQTHQHPSLRSGTGSQKHRGSAGLHQQPLDADSTSASSGHNMRPMFVQGNSTGPSLMNGEFMTRSGAYSASQPPIAEPQHLLDPYNPRRGSDLNENNVQPAAKVLQSGSSSADTNSRKLSDDNRGDQVLPERRKHHHVDKDVDDSEDRTSKRTRVDGEDFIDGDNDAPWMPGASRRSSLLVPKRGSKRHANHEDEDDWEMSQDKRARKGSLAVPGSDAMGDNDVDMANGSSDAELQPTRGTKRERDDPDSVDDPAENSDDLHRSQPSRKRRAEGRRREDEPPSRGRKRDRSPENPGKEGGERDGQATRHKRGRRHEREEDDETGSADASESDDIPDFTEDPACGGRRIGEIWEVNGQSFKVGLDGRRLRHALVKQQRNKFPMPKDSAHNDARTNVDVVVEKWLNDEEYKAAKEGFELAWQDPSHANTPIKAEATMEDEHSSAGKRLLWGGPPPSPVKGRASISSSSIQNPFDLAPSNVGRRAASGHFLMNNSGESPKLRSSKLFSKWEKQDMEANSLKKMRARLEKEKKEKEQQEKAKSSLLPATVSIPLASTTNKPTQEIKSTTVPAATVTESTKTTTPAVPSLFAKPASNTLTAPSPFAKPASDISASPSPFAKPASNANAGSIPNFFAKPATTSAATAPGATTQLHSTSMFPTSTQIATTSSATTVPTVTKPSLTFGPPPTSASTSTEANKDFTAKPVFSLLPTSSTPFSAPTATGDSKPTFNFGTPSPQANINDPPKAHALSFANPQATSTTSSGQEKSPTPNTFAKPTSQPATAPFTPAGNSPFSFNQSSQPPQTAIQKPSTFQFGTPSTLQNNNSGTHSEATSSSGSLLNRLGPPVTSSEPSKATTTTPNAWSSSFGSPSPFVTSTNPPSTSIFGQTQGTSNLSQSSNKPSPFTPSGLAKNVFGQPSSMSSAAPSTFSFATPPAASKTVASPSGGDASLPQPAALSIFGKPSGQSEASKSTPATHIFGKPSDPSGAPGSQLPAFSMFGKSTGLSESSQPAPPSISEKPGSQSELVSQSIAPSIFGNPSGQFESSKSTLAAPSVFGNLGGQPEAQASQPKSAFSFNFGNNSISTSTPNANPFNTSQAPSMGAQAIPAAPNNFFAFGQSSSTTTPGMNAFGFSNKPTEGDKK